jgi:tetratricopeptide (TPR) repeat protein/transcriptional regulator with XRE-family HTH domain
MKKADQAIPNHLLRQERELRGWSQKYVAEQIDAASYYISRWECGAASPSPYFRSKLCTLFAKNAQDLGLLRDELEQSSSEITHATSSPKQQAAGDTNNTDSVQTSLYDPAIPLPFAEHESFVGRETILHDLKHRMCVDNNPVLTAINGLPGVGKTALAVELVYDREVRAAFCDGILWAGLGPGPDIIAHLSRWGSLLGISSAEMAKLKSCEAWALAIHTAIGNRRMLLIIDDAWKIEDALALKIGGPNCVHLLTTRLPEVATRFAGDRVIFMHELDEEDGLRLLMRLAPIVAETEPAEMQVLVQSVGGLPLALTLIGNYLCVQSHGNQQRRIHNALVELHKSEKRLQLEQPQGGLENHPGLSAGTPLSLQAVIGLSEAILPESAKQVLRALATFPAKPNTFSEEAALAVAQTSVETLDLLVDAGLLESCGFGCYRLHQTIADYARFQQANNSSEQRMAAYYADFVEVHARNFALLEQESVNLRTAMQVSYEQNMQEVLIRLVNAFFGFLENRGLHAQATQYLQRAEQIERALGDHRALATTLFNLGRIADKNGAYELADEYSRNGLIFARQCGQSEQTCAILNHLGSVAIHRSEYSKAQAYLEESLQLARQTKQLDLASTALANLGVIAGLQGEDAKAETFFKEGLQLVRQTAQHERICHLLANLGVAAGEQGDHVKAEMYFQEGLILARLSGHCVRTIHILTNLGQAILEQGDYARAEDYLIEALALARQIDHKGRIIHSHLTLATLANKKGQGDDADHHLQKALLQAHQINNPRLISLVLFEQGRIQLERGQLNTASTMFNEALTIVPEDNRILIAKIHSGLAQTLAAGP